VLLRRPATVVALPAVVLFSKALSPVRGGALSGRFPRVRVRVGVELVARREGDAGCENVGSACISCLLGELDGRFVGELDGRLWLAGRDTLGLDPFDTPWLNALLADLPANPLCCIAVSCPTGALAGRGGRFVRASGCFGGSSP